MEENDINNINEKHVKINIDLNIFKIIKLLYYIIMIHIGMSVFMALLFVLLTPGVLLRLPKHGSLLQSAVVHSIVFALVYHFTHKFVWRMTSRL